MTLTAIICGIIGCVLWLIKRHYQRKDSPDQQRAQREKDLANEITNKDDAGASRSGSDDLDTINRLRH